MALPVPVGEFVGRERELARLHELLSAGHVRLITLVGPGGSGKTGLAAEALRREGGNRTVYWVGLARIAPDSATRAEDVVRSVVRARIVAPKSAGSAGPAATSGGRPILVLDTCEHVIAEVAGVVADLLTAGTDLTILATSRQPIGWGDEYLLTVPPLSPRHSLRLFRQRAELTGRPVPDDPERLDIVARICRHVDHNPLFIRMAAARLRHRPPARVLAELTGGADDKRLDWSYETRAGIEARHRGIHDTIAWSFDLCDVEERILLERLSVFAAGYTDDEGTLRNGIESAAVVAVCVDAVLPRDRAERALERLVERSLVSAHITAATTWWYLGESTRVFARERLRRSPAEAARLAGLYRRYYRDRVVVGDAMSFDAAEAAGVYPAEYRGRATVSRASELPRAEPAAQVVVDHESYRQAESRATGSRCADVEPRRCASGVRTRRSVGPESAAPKRPDSGWYALSPAEREVAVFAAAGWPNSAIAVRRHSSVRTVDAQVASVRQKLMISSRRDIVHHLPDELTERVRREREVTVQRSRAGRSPRDTPRP